MRLRIPLEGFLGRCGSHFDSGDGGFDEAAITLEHSDPALTVALHIAEELDDLAEEWETWGRVLGRPLLSRTWTATLHEPIKLLGAMMATEAAPRRRRKTPLRKRRPYFTARRKGFSVRLDAVVHRDEREIIARN